MPQRSRDNRRLLSAALLGVFGIAVLGGVFGLRSAARAQDSQTPAQTAAEAGIEATSGEKPTGGAAVSPGDPTGGAAKAAKTVNDKLVNPTIQMTIMTLLLDTVQYVLDRMAYEAAIRIASLGEGQTPLIYGQEGSDLFNTLALDIGGEMLGALSEVSTELTGFNLCAPPNPIIRLGIQAGLKQAYSPKQPKCDLLQVGQNWNGFINSTLQFASDPGSVILQEFAKGLRPGQNELSATIELNLELQNRISTKRTIDFQQALANDGFKSVTDFVTGQVKTPSSVLQNTFQTQLNESTSKRFDAVLDTMIANPDWLWAMGIQATSVFTNTLLSQIMNRVYTGLFETVPPAGNPFDAQGSALAAGGREQALQAFSELRTPTLQKLLSYNVLAEFVACPAGSLIVPTSNQCVMDSGFASAVARGETDAPLTVQEALDEGLLQKNWVLIPPDDTAKNQDPLCHKSAYCHSNLVKMRKARIIPVGWELAAALNSERKTLEEIKAEFNNCGEDGQSGSRFCHLIDPNWVLKYPESQCNALASGPQLLTRSGTARNSICADPMSCIKENPDGSCQGGFGYCVREENVWRFRGDECPEQFASCLAFKNTIDGQQKNFTLKTVDFSVCGLDNAGCRWYAQTKEPGVGGAYEFPLTAATFDERLYLDRDAQSCQASAAGCTELVRFDDDLVLNLIANPNFDDAGFWIGSVGNIVDDSAEAFSPDGYLLTDGTVSQEGIAVAGGNFYTLSFYAKSGNGSAATASVSLRNAQGGSVSVAGTSFSSDTCTAGASSFIINASLTGTYQRFTCVFSAPPATASMDVSFGSSNNQTVRIDAVQLEQGGVASPFTVGYNTNSPNKTYLRVAPDYFGCTGSPTDPPECGGYAQSCSALDMGCELYTPEDGDPPVPAVVSATDFCPSECVGYTTYKQEATKYETAKFPLFFIADRAESCQQQHAGCDAFTNLDTLAAGGEGIEHYTDLRACQTPENAGDDERSFFTWEGSDQAGFQLRSWQLLESNLPTGTIVYAQGGGLVDENQQLAPCTSWSMTGAGSMQCNDSAAVIAADDGCNEHDDILDPLNADCREFFDDQGNIHYRRFSQTVTVSTECSPYRKSDSTSADCAASGGFFTAAGECRYFGLPSESVSCPAAASGCRLYTGGAGRNAVTILSEGFESGTIAGYVPVPFGSGATLTYSNESLAPDGHSIGALNADAGEGFATSPEKLEGLVVPGKTFLVQFWARGSANINVAFEEAGGSGPSHAFGTAALEGAWQLYSFGPMDTSAAGFSGFDDTAILTFRASAGASAIQFFVDNIQLKQVEDNIAIIKDSWVVPRTCDQAPTSPPTPVPQYYLGCEAYTDRSGDRFTLYQFSRLCGEDVIGCQAFFDTQNSDSPHGKVYQARCNGAAGACSVNGQQVCTVSPGKAFCLFDYDGSFGAVLPGNVTLGPEAQVVRGDEPKFVVDNGTMGCLASAAGCEELGLPQFNRDKTAVTGYEVVYRLNDPDQYDRILCSDEALFCDEWSHKTEGNFYFKNPLDQTCEYKTGVTIGSTEFFGWFRVGTNEPCEWTDTFTTSAGETEPIYTPFQDAALLVKGRKFDIRLNGDDAYDGWVGQCPQEQDMCSEFVDPNDVDPILHPNGSSVYFKDNDKLSESNVSAALRCDGQVSRSGGCALFQNTSVSELVAATDPSYLASDRADVLFNRARFGMVDPVDCSLGAVANNNDLGLDLCTHRCQYATTSPLPVKSVIAGGNTYGNACISNDDCPALAAGDGAVYSGTCVDVNAVGAGAARFRNDANQIVKVNRNRECSQWLSCASENLSFNSSTQKWESTCEAVELCSRFQGEGDSVHCTAPDESDPVVLDANVYRSRDVTWNGREYSGYSIPNKLPVDQYDQLNVNPARWCTDASGNPVLNDNGVPTPCTTSCTVGTCEDADKRYILAHDAGPCVAAQGADCAVGRCEDTGAGCRLNAQCGGSACVFGYCQLVAAGSACASNNDCSGSTPVCDAGICVSAINSASTCDATGAGCGGGTVCRQSAVHGKEGQCFNQQCLVNIDGTALNLRESVDVSCRGFPEIDSPFPNQVITNYDGDGAFVGGLRVPPKPTAFKSGFEKVSTCAPIWDATAQRWATSDDCMCSYKKVEFGKGILNQYYPIGERSVPAGICFGGPNEGNECRGDSDCGDLEGGQTGFCALETRSDQYLGWDGFCIEHDSANQLYGSSNAADRPCYTWFPVDRLTGATDLFAKSVEAGYPAEDSYYCTEVGYYMDLYPTGSRLTATGTVVKGDKDNPAIDVACAASKVTLQTTMSCDWGQYGNCESNAYCPEGWTAVLGWCDSNGGSKDKPSDGNLCKDGWLDSDSANKWYFRGGSTSHDGRDDCPYFCLPQNSYHSQGETIGEKCEDTLAEITQSTLVSEHGTSVAKVGDLTFEKLQKFADCVVRGVPANSTTYDTDWYFGRCEDHENRLCLGDADCEAFADASDGELCIRTAEEFDDIQLGNSAGGHTMVRAPSALDEIFNPGMECVGEDGETGQSCSQTSECGEEELCVASYTIAFAKEVGNVSIVARDIDFSSSTEFNAWKKGNIQVVEGLQNRADSLGQVIDVVTKDVNKRLQNSSLPSAERQNLSSALQRVQRNYVEFEKRITVMMNVLDDPTNAEKYMTGDLMSASSGDLTIASHRNFNQSCDDDASTTNRPNCDTAVTGLECLEKNPAGVGVCTCDWGNASKGFGVPCSFTFLAHQTTSFLSGILDEIFKLASGAQETVQAWVTGIFTSFLQPAVDFVTDLISSFSPEQNLAYGLAHRVSGSATYKCGKFGNTCDPRLNDGNGNNAACSLTTQDLPGEIVDGALVGARACAILCAPYLLLGAPGALYYNLCVVMYGPACVPLGAVYGLATFDAQCVPAPAVLDANKADMFGNYPPVIPRTADPVFSASIRPYLGCYEITQVSSREPIEGSLNKAMTDRVRRDSGYTTGENAALGYHQALGYGYASGISAFGRAPLDEYFVRSNGNYYMKGLDDSFPLTVRACDNTQAVTLGVNLTPAIVGLQVAPDGTQCQSGPYAYPSANQYLVDKNRSVLVRDHNPSGLALAYEYFGSFNPPGTTFDRDDELTAVQESVSGAPTEAVYSSAFGNSDGYDSVTQNSFVYLSQLFTKAFKRFEYVWNLEKDGRAVGGYVEQTTPAGRVTQDLSGTGGTAPVVRSIGPCVGGKCREGRENAFNVNNFDAGQVHGGDGYLRATVNFFAYADANQMPIRNILVDWGDATNLGTVDADEWPIQEGISQTGSTADDNFYKNRRGTNNVGQDECDGSEWGKTRASCDTSFITFNHDYTCTPSKVSDLAGRLCILQEQPDGEMRLLNSPCTGNAPGTEQIIIGADGRCVYQPRVHVKDNWEYCTGFCNNVTVDESCYQAECNPLVCPDYGACPGPNISTKNPWVNFDGVIVIEPNSGG